MKKSKRVFRSNGGVFKVWTRTEDKELMGLLLQDITYKEIAKVLGRTNDACRTRAKLIRKGVLYSNATEKQKLINLGIDYDKEVEAIRKEQEVLCANDSPI